MPKNNVKTVSTLSAVLAVDGICLAVLGILLKNSRWLTEAGILLAVIFGICFAVCFPRSRLIDRLMRGDGLLAHWYYTDAEQREYAVSEAKARKKSNLSMLLVITGVCAVLTVLVVFLYFGSLEKASGLIAVMIGVLALLWLSGLLSPSLSAGRMQNGCREAFIGTEAAWVFGNMAVWKTLRSYPTEVGMEKDEKDLCRIAVRYIVIQRRFKQEFTFRIPVPQGKESEACGIAETIKAECFRMGHGKA
jgi:hypothetical protein